MEQQQASNMQALPEEILSASSSCVVSGDLSYTASPKGRIIGHCNGLLLRLRDVVNPATQQWAPLPPRPPLLMSTKSFFADPYLVFDPAISPHYEVFLMLVVAWWAHLDEAIMARSEWPPSLCETHVFSSRTGRWEERSFVREGQPAGTIAGMKKTFTTDKRYSVYWRGALYVHCQNDFICKVSMAGGNKYQVINPPVEKDTNDPHAPYLGRSEKGVYCAILDRRGFRLRVWILDESSGKMEWVIRHQNHLESVLASQDSCQQVDDGACWCFKDINHYADHPEDDGNDEEPTDHRLKKHSNLTLLGLHPFKEIVYLNSDLRSRLAYDLNTSKVQDLGNMHPK